MDFLFSTISRFVAMAGIADILQTVATDLLARLANPSLTEEEFEELKQGAESRGYVLDRA